MIHALYHLTIRNRAEHKLRFTQKLNFLNVSFIQSRNDDNLDGDNDDNDDDTIGENIEACEARQWKNGDSDAIWIMAPSHRTTSMR